MGFQKILTAGRDLYTIIALASIILMKSEAPPIIGEMAVYRQGREMKNKKVIYVILGSVLSSFITAILIAGQTVSSSINELQKLNLKADSQKREYLLGEKIRLNVQVSNQTSQDILPTDPLAKSCAYLRVFVSADGQAYSEYFGSGFQIEGCEINLRLKSGESYNTGTTLLWNGDPEFLRVNKAVRDTRPTSGYAISKPGVYFIKAALSFSDESLSKIETEPIRISINEPAGDELKVWNVIKDKGEIAYLIQNDFFQNPRAGEKLRGEIEELTAKYPDSLLANQIKQSLEKFREGEEKRKKVLRKSSL